MFFFNRFLFQTLANVVNAKGGVQITPHRTPACAHFSRCVPHFAQFIQCTCIGSRCLSDSVCLSKSSHPRTMSLLGSWVPCFPWCLAFVSDTSITADWNQTEPVRESALGWTVWPPGRPDAKHILGGAAWPPPFVCAAFLLFFWVVLVPRK